MHVCLICVEMFGLGHYGGFGRATRIIGRELAKRNIQVTVAVPRRSQTCPDEMWMDGMRVRQFRPSSPRAALQLFHSSGADVFHSQDPSMGTYWAYKAAPTRPHLITFRDPLDAQDWRIEWTYSGANKVGWLLYSLYTGNAKVTSAVRQANGRYCAAGFIAPKAMKKYGLRKAPTFLPTPIEVPKCVTKANRPTVCFVGRWHRRKRPDVFLQLAEKFPHVDFIAVGAANERHWDNYLRRRFRAIKNLTLSGEINQFESDELSDILGRSWILVNTSAREGLPTAFLEAAAHRCAILSGCDPDRFVSRFGYHASVEELPRGLQYLIEQDRWRKLGEMGHEYVQRVFSLDQSIDRHVQLYQSFIA